MRDEFFEVLDSNQEMQESKQRVWQNICKKIQITNKMQKMQPNRYSEGDTVKEINFDRKTNDSETLNENDEVLKIDR